MANDWKGFVGELSQFLPLKEGDGTSLFENGIDHGLQARLSEAVGLDLSSVANANFVEDLLSDCISRINGCLSLREQAWTIEIDAIHSATSIEFETKAALLQRNLQTIVADRAPKQLQYAEFLKSESGSFEFGPISSEEEEVSYWEQIKAIQSESVDAIERRLAIITEKSKQPGNAAQYKERFAFVRSFYQNLLTETFKRCLACKRGLEEIYDITVALPDINSSAFLNDLAEWGQKVSDELDRKLDFRLRGQVIFSVSGRDKVAPADLLNHELIQLSEFQNKLDAGTIDFDVSDAKFSNYGMENVRLRKIALHIENPAPKNRIWQAVIELPENTLMPGTPKYATLATSSPDQIAGGEHFVRSVHNLSPIGSWEIQLSKFAVSGEPSNFDHVKNIYLLMDVTYNKR